MSRRGTNKRDAIELDSEDSDHTEPQVRWHAKRRRQAADVLQLSDAAGRALDRLLEALEAEHERALSPPTMALADGAAGLVPESKRERRALGYRAANDRAVAAMAQIRHFRDWRRRFVGEARQHLADMRFASAVIEGRDE